jgi:molybdopterin/thiamine biosynthesis adenylyltransferase
VFFLVRRRGHYHRGVAPLPLREHRYARHLVLPQVGPAGHQAIRQAHVVCVGAGGLGSPVLQYLGAAGIGRLTVIDPDVVSLSNLQRQVVFGTDAVGLAKVDVARRRLAELNADVLVDAHHVALDDTNAASLLAGADVVVDATDNFDARYAINRATVASRTSLVHASIYRFEGVATTFNHADGPCYACLYPTKPGPDAVANCSDAGVLGVLPGVLGTIQATEALKLIIGIGQTLSGRLLTYDALNMTFGEYAIARNPECGVCGTANRGKSD